MLFSNAPFEYVLDHSYLFIYLFIFREEVAIRDLFAFDNNAVDDII